MGTHLISIGVAASLLLAASPACAKDDLPRTHLKIVGMQSHLNAYKTGEKPFWEETIPAASNGAVTADITPQDLNGLKGPEILRLVKLGVIDFASGVIGYMAGDSPEFDGLDLAGLSSHLETTRKVVDAYLPVLSEVMERQYGAKLLILYPAPPQVMWCRSEVRSVGDLKGLTVRVFTASMADLIGGLGATTVTMPFGEVTAALERGVIDCAVTGTLSGNTNKMFEITDYMYSLYSGWSPQFTAVSLESWNKLDPKVQEFLLAELEKFEDKLWTTAAEEEQDGINCSIGKDPCKYGFKGGMILNKPSDEDLSSVKDVVQNTVVPNWAKRCGEACSERWIATVGPVVGIYSIDNK